MSTKLYLARHGETFDNKAQIMQGQTQGELNATGIIQAETMKTKLAGEYFDVYMSSDLRRAFDTCAIIAGVRKDAIVTTPLLRERDWGDFTGRYIPDLKGLPFPDNVESLDELKRRASEFLSFIRNDYGGKKVFAVGHGIINKAVQSVFYDKPMSEIAPMKNLEIRVLEM